VELLSIAVGETASSASEQLSASLTQTSPYFNRELNIFWPGDIFGMICVSGDQRRLGLAQAIAPVSVLTTTGTGLAQLLRSRADRATDLWHDLLDQQRRITLRVEALLSAEWRRQRSPVEDPAAPRVGLEDQR